MIERIQKYLNFIFLGLLVLMLVILLLFWFSIMIPYLKKQAQIDANKLALAKQVELNQAFNQDLINGTTVQIKSIIQTYLLLKERNGNRIYNAIEIQAGPAALADKFNHVYQAKNIKNVKGFKTKVPIFDEKGTNLLAVAFFFRNELSFQELKNTMLWHFSILFTLIFLVLFASWGLLKCMIKNIQAQQAKLIHSARVIAMGEMASGIAHELNQPLAIMRFKADALQYFFAKKLPDSDKNKSVADIIDQIKRAATIIRNMRSFTSPNSEILELLNLSEPLDAALSFFREQFRVHDIRLLENISPDLPKVRLNPQKFEQIVVNLLTNARHAVEHKEQISGAEYQKQIEIRLLHSIDQKILFEVKDNGVGMDENTCSRCLEPFFTTKETGEGMGLGLSIVFGIMREFDMTLNIESKINVGASFQLSIPVKEK